MFRNIFGSSKSWIWRTLFLKFKRGWKACPVPQPVPASHLSLRSLLMIVVRTTGVGTECRVHRRTFQPGVWTSASWQHVQRYNRLMCFLFGTVDSVNHGHTRHATSPLSLFLSLWTSTASLIHQNVQNLCGSRLVDLHLQNRWICQLFFPTHVTFLVVRVSSLLTERRSWINKILFFGTGGFYNIPLWKGYMLTFDT